MTDIIFDDDPFPIPDPDDATDNQVLEYDGGTQTWQAVDYLALDNTDAFTPTADTHPATKGYVDDNAADSAHTHANSVELAKVTDGDHDVIASGNPHSVTVTELSLENVDNTTDANKPVSTAVNAAFLSRTNTTAFTPTANYHPATKLYVDDHVGGDAVSYLKPADTAAENATNFQAAADDSDVSVVVLTPGTYDYETELFLYGKKSLVAQPGAIMRITADLSLVSHASTGGIFLHLGTEGVDGPVNTWTDSVLDGIEFQGAAGAICKEIVHQHGCDNIKIQNCFWNMMSADSDVAFVNSIKWYTTSGPFAAYVTDGNYGTFTNGQYLYNRVETDQLNYLSGYGGVGLRAIFYQNITMIGNSVVGVGDDPLDAGLSVGVTITNNYVDSCAGRIIANVCNNVLISNNRCTRSADRAGDWQFGALIGAKTYLGAASYDAYGPNGDDTVDMRSFNINISNNVLIVPADTSESSIGIELGGNQNLVCEGNVLWNKSTTIFDFIHFGTSSQAISSPGLPIAIRNNKNCIVRNNIVFTDTGGLRTRIVVGAIDPDTVNTVTIDATDGTFTLTYTDKNDDTYVTGPIDYDANAATGTAVPGVEGATAYDNVQAALRALTTDEEQGINTRAVTVSGTAPYTITMTEISGTPVTTLISDAANLTGGAATAVVADTTGADLSGGDGMRVEGNMSYSMNATNYAELSIAACDDITIKNNRVGSRTVATSPESFEFGHDDIIVTSTGASNAHILPDIIDGMAPIKIYVGDNGFRLSALAGTTINGAAAVKYSAYAIIPADVNVLCTPQGTTNWIVETITDAGVRAAATMV